MQNLNADPATLFKALFLAQLPLDVWRILATSSKTEIADLALEADRITEVTRLTQDTQVNATKTPQIPLRSGPSKPSKQIKNSRECASTIPRTAIRPRNVCHPASFKPLRETYQPHNWAIKELPILRQNAGAFFAFLKAGSTY